MISGHATPDGTKKFSQKNSSVLESNFKETNGLVLSNVGIGTYLGDPNEQTDILVKNAVKTSILSGVNVIDTAINYRSQKAERSVGAAISELVQENKITRDEIFVSTKNGYVTNDGDIKEEFWAYVNREYVKNGVIQANDISSGYHCMTVPYLEDQLNRSLKNLELECIDLMYLHNAVEGQIRDVPKDQFMKKKGKEKRKRDRRRDDRRKGRKEQYLGNDRRKEKGRRLDSRRKNFNKETGNQDLYSSDIEDEF